MDQQAIEPATAERAAVASDLTLWGRPRDRTSQKAAQVGLLFGPGSVAFTTVAALLFGLWERGTEPSVAFAYLCTLTLVVGHLISAVGCFHTIVDRWWRRKPSWLVFPLWLYWLLLVVALCRG